MFKTMTAAKIYIKQGFYKEALEILEHLDKNDDNLEILFYKAVSYEGIGLDEKAVKICERLIKLDSFRDDCFNLIERIKNKKNEIKNQSFLEYTEDEIAKVYEMIEDYENAIFWYNKKIEKLKEKLKD